MLYGNSFQTNYCLYIDIYVNVYVYVYIYTGSMVHKVYFIHTFIYVGKFIYKTTSNVFLPTALHFYFVFCVLAI